MPSVENADLYADNEYYEVDHQAFVDATRRLEVLLKEVKEMTTESDDEGK